MSSDGGDASAPSSESNAMAPEEHENHDDDVGVEELSEPSSSIDDLPFPGMLGTEFISDSIIGDSSSYNKDDVIGLLNNDIDILTNRINNMKRGGLRGVSVSTTRALQSQQDSLPSSPSAQHEPLAGDNNYHENNNELDEPFASWGNNSNSNYQTTDNSNNSNIENDDGGMLLSILCMLIVSPCVLACIAQSIYYIKKRRQDRVERRLEEVSTNPTSRMLVLSEIFKNDSRPVTEDDASPRKKRVKVKKHRKKTPTERQGKSRDAMDSNVSLGADDIEAGRNRGETDEWNEDEEDDILSTASDDEKPSMIVYISENIEHASSSEEQDNVSTLDDEEEEQDEITPAVQMISSSEDDAVYEDGETNVAEGTDENEAGHQSFASNRSDGVDVDKDMSFDTKPPDVEKGQGIDVDKDKSFDANPPVAEKGKGIVNDKDTCTDLTSNEDSVDGVITCKTDSNDSDLDGVDNNVSDGENRDESKDGTSTKPESNFPKSDDKPSARLESNGKLSALPLSDGKPDSSMSEKDSAKLDTPQTVSLAPKIPSRPSLDDEGSIKFQQDKASRISPTDAAAEGPSPGPDIPPLTIAAASPKNYISPRALSPQLLAETYMEPSDAPSILAMPILSDDDSDAGGWQDSFGNPKNSIFRAATGSDEGDALSTPEIHACGSSVTEVTSNVDALKEVGTSSFDDIKLEPLLRRTTSQQGAAAIGLFPPYQLERVDSEISTLSGLGAPIPINRVESYKSTASSALSSNISYFSFEDISIASEDAEMCAICLCPYEEGDIRIFSKRCPHAFHKLCILEWLVKSHNECPCCRKDMVTKSEIKETSASLIGTERLAQAMAVVNGSEMQEAPPFRVRRPRLAHQTRQMLARARAQRRRASSGQAHETRNATMLTPQSPNSHWIWSARFDQPSTPTGTGPSSMLPLNELHTSPPTPTRSNNGGNNINSRDWLWATRFNNSSSQNDQQPRTINPSRSSDAIMNPHETNQNTAASPSATASALEPSMHNTTAGSLFSSNPTTPQRDDNNSMFHGHWQRRWGPPPPRRTTTPMALSPNRLHDNWRSQSSSNSSVEHELPRLHANWRSSNSNSDNELPVTVLPAI